MATLAARITAVIQAIRDKINTLPRSKPFTVGDGVAKEFTLTHNLGTMDIIPACREVAAPYQIKIADYFPVDDNNITVKFKDVPTANQYRLVFIGAKP